jgi:hypothetical protein
MRAPKINIRMMQRVIAGYGIGSNFAPLNFVP